MAHFAQLDSNNVVTQVLVVNNADILDDSNVEQESLGVTFLQNLLGANTVWKQTSYNGNMRKNYAGIGYTYDSGRDSFIPPQPYNSWVIDETTCLWEAPIDRPTLTQAQIDAGSYYAWDETAHQADTADPKTIGWVLTTPGD